MHCIHAFEFDVNMADGILGALKGDLVDVLIVDMDTAQHLLDT